MKRLRKFLHLPPTERDLLIKAATLLWTIRLGLWLLPFQTLRQLLTHVGRTSTGWHKAEADRYSSDRAVWAVAVASQYVPGARTCLIQAMAVQVLLQREGYPALLRIGVAMTRGEPLQAHAWVESQGKIVFGGPEVRRYTPLPALELKT